MVEVLERTPTTSAPQLPALRWHQVLSHLDPKYGGISTVVPELADSLAPLGINPGLDAFCAAGEQYRPAALQPEALHFWPIQRGAWLSSATLRRSFTASVEQVDGLHVHGLWDATSWIAARAARSSCKPYVLSAHGMLEPWALRQGWLKKRLYATAIERDIVRRAHCLHALTDAEAVQYRRFAGPGTPIVVIPNGVTIPADVDAEPFLQQFPALRGRRVVLFLARLHVKKGVDLLVNAWAAVSQKFPEAVLVIAGPDSDCLRSKLEALVAEHGLTPHVVFTGLLSSTMKWSAFAVAECMVLPSHSEGLSMSVLEAMGAGVPVLLTPQCNMPWVQQAGAGWLTEPDTDALSRSLSEVLGQGTAVNAVAGAAARRRIGNGYSWHAVAQRMAEVYRWIDGGPLPSLSEVLR